MYHASWVDAVGKYHSSRGCTRSPSATLKLKCVSYTILPEDSNVAPCWGSASESSGKLSLDPPVWDSMPGGALGVLRTQSNPFHLNSTQCLIVKIERAYRLGTISNSRGWPSGSKGPTLLPISWSHGPIFRI